MLVFDPKGIDQAVFDSVHAGRAAKWIMDSDNHMGRTGDECMSYANALEYVRAWRRGNKIHLPAKMLDFPIPVNELLSGIGEALKPKKVIVKNVFTWKGELNKLVH